MEKILFNTTITNCRECPHSNILSMFGTLARVCGLDGIVLISKTRDEHGPFLAVDIPETCQLESTDFHRKVSKFL